MSKRKVAMYVIGGIFALGIVANITGDAEPVSENKTEVVEKVEQKGLTNEQYNTIMAEHYFTFAEIMSEYSDLMFEGSADPSLMFTSDYQANVQEICSIMLQSIDEMRAVTPPADYEQQHSSVLEALDNFEFVAENVPSAIENMDTGLMAEIVNHMNEGNAILAEVVENL